MLFATVDPIMNINSLCTPKTWGLTFRSLCTSIITDIVNKLSPQNSLTHFKQSSLSQYRPVPVPHNVSNQLSCPLTIIIERLPIQTLPWVFRVWEDPKLAQGMVVPRLRCPVDRSVLRMTSRCPRSNFYLKKTIRQAHLQTRFPVEKYHFWFNL